MTVFDSLQIDLRKPNIVFTFQVKINTDTSRAGITIGIVDPKRVDPRNSQGCELCETERGWGVFVCKGIRDKFTNGVYHRGEYVCGKDARQIREGWRKDDVIEIQLEKGTIRYLRNGELIPEVSVSDNNIQGCFVFAVTLYNSRLEVQAVSRERRLSQFTDPRQIVLPPCLAGCSPILSPNTRRQGPPILSI